MAAPGNADQRFRQSYQRGLLIFGYGLVWLVVSFTGLLGIAGVFPVSNSLVEGIIVAVWASALVGALAGTAAMFQQLGQALVNGTQFLQRSLWPYLVRPLLGLLAGMISLGVVMLPLTVLINLLKLRSFLPADNLNALVESFASPTGVTLYLLLAAIAGYYLRGGLKQFVPPDEDETTQPAAAAKNESEAPFAFQAWVEQRQEMIDWSFTWGVVLFLYGLLGLIVLIASLWWQEALFAAAVNSGQFVVRLIGAAWPTLVAGGVGGIIGMLYHLYHHISLDQDFHRQHVMNYLIQPVLGVVFAGCMYLFISGGYLSWQASSSLSSPEGEPSTVFAVQLVLGWLVGFRPTMLVNLIRRIVQAIVAFFRSFRNLLKPKTLLSEPARSEAIFDLAQQAELFRPLEGDLTQHKP